MFVESQQKHDISINDFNFCLFFFIFKVSAFMVLYFFLLIPSAIFKAKDIRFENMEKLKMWSLSDCLPMQVAPINGKKKHFHVKQKIKF